MADLKTDYKDDVLDTEVNELRKYRMIQNEDGTVSFVDVTEYLQVGDSFGSADVNAITERLTDGVFDAMEEVEANTQENMIGGALALKELKNIFAKVVDTNSTEKVKFTTEDSNDIGLPTGFYKVATLIDQKHGDEGFNLAIGHYGGDAIGRVFFRTFVDNVYSNWIEIAKPVLKSKTVSGTTSQYGNVSDVLEANQIFDKCRLTLPGNNYYLAPSYFGGKKHFSLYNAQDTDRHVITGTAFEGTIWYWEMPT